MSKLGDSMKNLARGLLYLVAILSSGAILGYIIHTNFGQDGEAVGFQLATVSAVIGGLTLAGGLLDRGEARPGLALGMRRIGTMYLVATLAFVVFGVCSPLMDVSWTFMYASMIGMAFGAVFFAIGSVLLASKVPQLLASS